MQEQRISIYRIFIKQKSFGLRFSLRMKYIPAFMSMIECGLISSS